MVIKIKTTSVVNPAYKSRNGKLVSRTTKKRIIILKCDNCDVVFDDAHFRKQTIAEDNYHYCSVMCRAIANSKGNTLDIKTKQTKSERYGDERYNNHEKYKQTCEEKYGVECTLQIKEIREKTIATNMLKFGTMWPTMSDIVKNKIDFKSIFHKAHKTKKKNGTYKKSKQEDICYVFLCEIFFPYIIERQHEINNWLIDFYVKTENTCIFIQFDGTYWHGLDRPLDIIKKFKSIRDEAIYHSYLRDRKQDIWFTENKLVLVRVRSDDFYNALKSNKINEFLSTKVIL